jgi:hypothetical protein
MHTKVEENICSGATLHVLSKAWTRYLDSTDVFGELRERIRPSYNAKKLDKSNKSKKGMQR